MELVFPFRNITINTILYFFKKGMVKDFSDIKARKGSWREKIFNEEIVR